MITIEIERSNYLKTSSKNVTVLTLLRILYGADLESGPMTNSVEMCAVVTSRVIANNKSNVSSLQQLLMLAVYCLYSRRDFEGLRRYQ